MNFQIKFGTDGWRATPETGLNSENITICAQSFADYINSNYPGKKSIIIGYDTRVDSKKYAVFHLSGLNESCKISTLLNNFSFKNISYTPL